MLMNPEEREEFSSAEKSIVSAVKTAAAGFSVNFEMQKWMRRLFSGINWAAGCSSGLERGDEWQTGLVASKLCCRIVANPRIGDFVKSSKNAANPAGQTSSDSTRSAHMFASATEFDSFDSRAADEFLARERTVWKRPYLQSTVRCKVGKEAAGRWFVGLSPGSVARACLPVGTVKLPPGCCCPQPAGH